MSAILWHLYDDYINTLEFAKIEAEESYQNDFIYRAWNAEQGGIYVPVSDKVQPDPYLSHIEDRDIITDSGLMLTLLNPSHMSRQIAQKNQQPSHKIHITSLNPLSPTNNPDDWERQALSQFEKGQVDVTGLGNIGGVEYLRFMRPLYAEKDCIKCHQDYSSNQLVGGISVSVLMAPLWQRALDRLAIFVASYVGIWLIGMLGIRFAASKIWRRILGRARAEEELREGKARIRALIETIPELVWLKDLNGAYLSCNRKFERLYGVPESEVIGKTAADFVSIEDAHAYEEKDKLVISTGESCVSEETVIFADDNHTEILESIRTPMFDSNGKLIGVLGVARDISERKKNEELMALHAKRTEALLELPKVAEKVTETEFMQRGLEFMEDLTQSCISFVHFFHDDEQGLELISWSRRTLTDYCQVVHDNHYPLRNAGIWADAARTKKVAVFNDYENYSAKKGLPEGHAKLTRFISLPIIENGKVVMLAGVGNKLEDYNELDVETMELIADEMWRIIQRQRSQQELSKLAQAVEQSPESIVITNLEAEIEYVNQAFVDKTGYSHEEAIGKNPRILQSGNTPLETYKEMWGSLKSEQPWRGEFYNKHKDGHEYIELAIITPIRNIKDEVSHYVAVKEDITEKKSLEQELDSHRHHLEQVVIRRTHQLDEARLKAEGANKAKSTFLANMSHEIRTPMNAIIGLTHLLQRNSPKSEDFNRLKKIDVAAGHLLAVIDDILDISKIEAGKLTLEESNFHLNSIFDYVQSMLREQANQKGISVKIDRNDVPLWLRGDPTRIRQALLNYASNAIKFTEQGEVFIRAKLLKKENEKVFVRFEVEDTGIGIAQEKLTKLFDVFEQADASTTRKYGGSGLGLAITRSLVQMMGGETGASSELGKGSLFWFTAWLDFGKGVVPESASVLNFNSETELRRTYSGSRILLVEDNAINREVAQELLNAAGMDVDCAENGREAVDKVRENDYALVLMDIQMPEMDGLEATRVIRTMQGKSSLPVLAMTANVFADDRQACKQAGMDDFVAKPVNPSELFSRLGMWLPKRSGSNKIFEGTKNPPDVLEHNRQLLDQLKSIKGIDIDEGLHHVHGDFDGYMRLLNLFGRTHGEDSHQFKNFLAAGRNNDALRVAHNLKGAAATLGLFNIQNSARLLEVRLSMVDKEEIPKQEVCELMDSIGQEISRITSVLHQISQTKVKNIVSNTEALVLIKQLEKLLEIDDTQANILFEKEKEGFRLVLGTRVDELEREIERFNYQSALDIVRSISSDVQLKNKDD